MKGREFWLKQLKILTLLLLAASLTVPFGLSEAVVLKSTFPKRANYFLAWDMSLEQARELAKWDLVILDMEHQVKSRDKIEEMRRINPHIVLIAYITAQEIRNDVPRLAPYVPLRAKLWSGIQSNWWLTNSIGQKISWWPGTSMLNITSPWSEYLANFISKDILSSGLWDGVFFDNTWNSLTEKIGNSADIKDVDYRQGMNNFFARVRELDGNKHWLMGIDGENFTGLNGMMFENFPYARGWSRMMNDYTGFPSRAVAAPAYSILNANTANAGGADDYQRLRFGLASALLGNGFYSFDVGDRDHGQTWWYDEYDFNLGESTAGPTLARVNSSNFNQKGIWRRDFKNGLVLVNSGTGSENIELNAEYEKLKGTQDPGTNDGIIVSSITLPSYDGLILLRPLDKLSNAVFTNGTFVRVFNRSGHSIRNGFFAYDSRFRGGRTLYSGAPNSVLADGNQIKIYDGGNIVGSFLPFGLTYKGTLSLAVADTDLDGQPEVIVGMGTGGSQVKIFDFLGREEKSFTALAGGSKAGVSVAVANINGFGPPEIIVGSAKSSSQIRIFSNVGKLVSAGWLVLPKSYKGGINVAAGDINGDDKAEIIAGAATGRPDVKIYDQRGKAVGKGFLGASPTAKNGVKVAAVDIDGDGVDEIVTYSGEVFTTALR
jgi:hypothetical protein